MFSFPKFISALPFSKYLYIFELDEKYFLARQLSKLFGYLMYDVFGCRSSRRQYQLQMPIMNNSGDINNVPFYFFPHYFGLLFL